MVGHPTFYREMAGSIPPIRTRLQKPSLGHVCSGRLRFLGFYFKERRTMKDRTGDECDFCQGFYEETSVNDDSNGLLHCNGCGDEIERYLTMKKWPENETKTVYFGDLVDPLVQSMEHIYHLEIKNLDDIPYDGYELGKNEGTSNLTPHEQLTKENLEYSLTEKGRSPLQEVLSIAVRLGIEQGRRIQMEKSYSHRVANECRIELLELKLENFIERKNG